MLIYHTFFIIITFPLDFRPGHIELQRIWLITITTNAKESFVLEKYERPRCTQRDDAVIIRNYLGMPSA